MRPVFSLLSAATLGLVLGGTAHAADVLGFNQMDKNNDGQLTRGEAQGNPKLADQFKQVDDDGDGKLSRTEYLAIMGRQDLYDLRENLAEFLTPEGEAPLAADGQQAGAGATAAGEEARGGRSLPPPVGEQLVRNVQDKLRAKGIDAGPVDGIWGPRTHAGLREFQQDEGLEATGQLSLPTLAALGIPGDSQGSTEQTGR
jgi:hypothetical protein